MPATINYANPDKQHWMKPSGLIACGAPGRALGLLTEVFHRSEDKCPKCFELYTEWWKEITHSGPAEDYTNRLRNSALAVIKHWDEFGQERDFEREVDALRRIVEERP